MCPRSKALSEQMKAKSRKAILAAALDLFARRGFTRTTTEQIAAKAGVSKGLIFTHFPTKQDILLAIFDAELHRLSPRMFELDNVEPSRANFVALIDRWFDLLKTEPLLIRLTLQLNLDDEYRKIIQKKGKEYMDHYLGGVRRLLARLGSKDPTIDTFLISVMFDGLAANYFVAPKLFKIEAVKDRFVKMMMASWGKTNRRLTLADGR